MAKKKKFWKENSMVKIIKYIKDVYLDFCAAQQELNKMGFFIVPVGYSYVILYLDPESGKLY